MFIISDEPGEDVGAEDIMNKADKVPNLGEVTGGW